MTESATGAFDQSGRFATHCDGEPILARLFRGELVRPRLREWLDSRTSPKPGDTDRTADKVAALHDERAPQRPWLMVFEFQAQHDEDKLDVTLTEAARLRIELRNGEERKGKYRVLVGLVYLRGVCPVETLDMTLPSGRGTRHMAFVWNVAEDDAKATLDEYESGRITWGILFWISLMKGGGEVGVICRWLRLVQVIPETERAALCQINLIFAELAGCAITWRDTLEEAKIKTESQLVNSWIETAEQRKELATTRDNLLRLLKRKFRGQVTAEVEATIEQQPSLTMLQMWFDEATDAATFAEFVAVLRR